MLANLQPLKKGQKILICEAISMNLDVENFWLINSYFFLEKPTFKVMLNQNLTYVVLAVWTWSLLQFVLYYVELIVVEKLEFLHSILVEVSSQCHIYDTHCERLFLNMQKTEPF